LLFIATIVRIEEKPSFAIAKCLIVDRFDVIVDPELD